jgi:aryl-alcohol dehydrogenase-like predicted oxidoreductase
MVIVTKVGPGRDPSGEWLPPARPEQLRHLGRDSLDGVTPAQVRIPWTLAQGPHVLAIPGTGDPPHLEQNVAAAALRLDL